jgi:hypothetical protein
MQSNEGSTTMSQAARCTGSIAVGLLAFLSATPVYAVAYKVQLADANLIGMTLTNYGVLGNNFVSRTASGEYPRGTGYEHLVYAGLWVGARATDGLGSFTGVTTGMLEISQGQATAAATEFTPSGDGLLRRSANQESVWYDPAAVSTLDITALFDDATLKPVSPYFEAHRPLNLAVRQVSYQWNQPGWEDFAIERFVIRNAGAFPLTDVHVGLYTLLASGPKNAYWAWPPSSSGSIYGSWYGKQLLAWDGPQRMLREHRCSAPPIPAGCQFEITPAWMGIQLLTPPASGQQVTVGVWTYAPGDTIRDQDVERYAILSAGTIAAVTDPIFLPGTGDPVEVLALGPFPTLAPGDSIEVAFAVVGGGDEAAILEHAATAQQMRDSGYQNPLVGVEDAPGIGRLRLAPVANPLSRRACSVVLELPESPSPGGDSPRLEVVDVSGRRVAERDLGLLGPGRHTIRLDEVSTMAPGVYFLRLTNGPDVAGSRIVVLP